MKQATEKQRDDWIEALRIAFGLHNDTIADLKDRRLFVSASFAHYGQASSVIIEFEGSPARKSFSAGDLQYSCGWVIYERKQCYRHNQAKAVFILDAARKIIAESYPGLEGATYEG